MIRRPPRSTPLYSSAASDVYKRQDEHVWHHVSTKPPHLGGRGPKELTGMVDLTRDERGHVHARLLDLVPGRTGQAYKDWSVSYTHLRAHETKANLVCRLLLEKKKKK